MTAMAATTNKYKVRMLLLRVHATTYGPDMAACTSATATSCWIGHASLLVGSGLVYGIGGNLLLEKA